MKEDKKKKEQELALERLINNKVPLVDAKRVLQSKLSNQTHLKTKK